MQKEKDVNKYILEDPLYDDYGKELPVIVLQEMIFQNKLNKGFNTTNPVVEFALLAGEFGELAKAIRDPKTDDIDEALVDITIFALGFFAIYEEDAARYLGEKLTFIEDRDYKINKRGFPELEKESTKPESEAEKEGMYPKVISDVQEAILNFRKQKGLNIDGSKLEVEYILIGEEMSELLEAIKNGHKDKILKAVTDVLLYTIGILGMRDQDSYGLITKKISYNQKRKYRVDSEINYQKIYS